METVKPKEEMLQHPGMASANSSRRPIRKIILGGLLVLLANLAEVDNDLNHPITDFAATGPHVVLRLTGMVRS